MGFETRERHENRNPEIRIPFLRSAISRFSIFLEVAQQSETVETNETTETLFLISNLIRLLACGFLGEIPQKSKKCLIP
jgi:hypothetical protein